VFFGRDPWQWLLVLPGLLVAITVHEYAHAAVAVAQGDPTPRLRGRLTLNPLRHIDLVGLLMLLTVGFGWARPVEINPYYFHNRRQGLFLVSLAGPLTNLLVALIGLVLLKALPILREGLLGFLLLGLYRYNLVLAVFNLLPIPPLDGAKVVAAAARGQLVWIMAQLEQYGWLVLVLLLWSGLIGRIMRPLLLATGWFLDTLSGLLVGF